MSIPAAKDILDPDEAVLELSEVSKLLGVSVSKVHQHLRDGTLAAVRRNGSVVVPRVFFDENGRVLKQLPGLLVVLRDGGFDPTEAMRWLFTPDESLVLSRDGSTERVENARPVDALRSHQAREVIRRAQALAY